MKAITKKLKEEIIKGEFREARKIANKLNDHDLEEFFLWQDYDKVEDIVFYLFLEDWALEVKDDKLLYLLSTLMASGLNWMPGAYYVALRHLKIAIEINSEDIYYKQFMLLFYEIPERLITLEEAEQYAREVLEVLPNDKASLKIIERLEKRNQNEQEE